MDVYTPKRVVEADGFPKLTFTFVPSPIHKVARHEQEVASGAKKEAEKSCKERNLKANTDDYRNHLAEVGSETEFVLKSKFLVEQIRSWDWSEGGHPVPITTEGVLSLPYPVFVDLRQIVLGYAFGKDVAEDEKKSE